MLFIVLTLYFTEVFLECNPAEIVTNWKVCCYAWVNLVISSSIYVELSFDESESKHKKLTFIEKISWILRGLTNLFLTVVCAMLVYRGQLPFHMSIKISQF